MCNKYLMLVMVDAEHMGQPVSSIPQESMDQSNLDEKG